MYVGHKNINFLNVPPTFSKFMSGYIFDIYVAAARRRRYRMPPLLAATTLLTIAACHRRMPYSATAIVDAFSNNNGETVVPSHGCLL